MSTHVRHGHIELAPDAMALPLDVPGPHGVRLDQFQLLNWGTFDGAVQRLHLGGNNALLTGQVGAGKSTLVDGLTTLFAAPSKVVFNRAAGAERSERTVNTYVLGHHRNVYDESTATARPEALRNAKSAFSVLLARFTGLPNGTLTTGVAFYFESSGALHRLYFTAPAALDIDEHLTGHTDARAVRAALRAAGAEVFDDNFKNYSRSLCRALGVTPAALDLLIQTVSMKSVGNLTTFVRAHMLDRNDAQTQIAGILEHWSDLTRAYELVQTARRQLDKLTEIADHVDAYDRAETRIAATKDARTAVPQLVEQRRVDLLGDTIATLEAELPAQRTAVETLDKQRRTASAAAVSLAVAVQQNGGSDLIQAKAELQKAQGDLARAAQANKSLRDLAAQAQVAPLEGTGDWARFVNSVSQARVDVDQAQRGRRDAEYAALRDYHDAKSRLEATEVEIDESTRRESNVPVADARLRARMAHELDLDPTTLPFAAELMKVADHATRWEGAVERLVRPLAMSVLVPDEHRLRVTAWVDANHLGASLVFYPVPTHTQPGVDARPGTMAKNVEVRPTTPFTAWLRAEVARRYDHVCVEAAADLSRHDRAVTPAGQIKNGTRHEKNDRLRVDDRRSYVLGWNTAARRAWLELQLPQMRTEAAALEQRASDATAARTELDDRRVALDQIVNRFPDPGAVDVAAAHEALADAQELHDLIAHSPKLADLLHRQDEAERRTKDLLDRLGKAQKTLGASEDRAQRLQEQLDAATDRLRSMPAPDLSHDAREALTAAVAAAAPASPDVSGIDTWGRAVTEELSTREASAHSTLARNANRLVVAMKEFKTEWPQVVNDIDTDPDARAEYLAIRDRLVSDDLPAYEADFREQLRENAIHELVVFSTSLHSESRRIGDRIDTINRGLTDIDYRPGTYIRLEHETTTDPDVRGFRAQLRDITSNSLADDETYAEERFLRVKALLDRFKGREGTTSADQAWTRRVTDVRNWFTFAASERTRDEDAQVEHYNDSGGKSGGQKEKLAYTVLAASLSYQYGLAGGHLDAFRFVMIDEAFGRGSDESTRFGLELFSRLGLQLLVVTPLQKISTIEPYVDAVGYVLNEEPRSRLITMTIEEYRASRETRDAARRAARSALHAGGDRSHDADADDTVTTPDDAAVGFR